MKKQSSIINENLKTFCPLPWNHISSKSSGRGRICCEGFEILKDDQNKPILWKESGGLYSYFNSNDYKQTRLQMLAGKRPKHCFHCFNQEDHGVRSQRLQFIDTYQSEIDAMINSTNRDGSIDNPKITYIGMVLGNKCNLKCRMCSPWSSYIIGEDWEKMNPSYDNIGPKKILEDKWYFSNSTLQMLKEALPHTQSISTIGGEPMIIKEHLYFLETIIKEGYSDRIVLIYDSNQTIIPKEIVELWKHFKRVTFNCSVEAFGSLNNYIRYPSKWENLEKNIYFLDDLSYKRKNMDIYIHTTLQAYNIMRIPSFLSYLRSAKFKNIYRFPLFIWVKTPQWLSPVLFPKKMRHEIADRILDSLKEHEHFFLNYNPLHVDWTLKRIQILREFCEMIKNDNSREQYLDQFIEETQKYDKLRKQSVLDVLPELKSFFTGLNYSQKTGNG